MKESLLNLIGWIFRNKKGFSLVELNISMVIQLMVLSIVINTTIITFRSYYILLNNSKSQDSFDDAVLNIERLLKGYMIQSINIDEVNNKITINYRKDNNTNEIIKKEISFEKGPCRIVLKTLNENNYQLGFNIIMLEVKDFIIIKKGNVYYLKITKSNSVERTVCL